MPNKKITEAIIDKINIGYDDYDLEKFLEQQEVNSSDFETLIEGAKNKILEHNLKTYPKQNKSTFIFCLSLFAALFLFFVIILPLSNISNGIIPISILGAISISLSGSYALLYYKSWNKDFIEKIGKPKFDLQNYILLFSLPTVLIYFMISKSFISGSGYHLYKLNSTIRLINSLFS
ncbi:hypothetical protein [Flavobacterium pectinovorum]|uniref:Uncharacterized protein n=1 Tax=Flavobacterium pectinovorum TaxID=29533 RepID=A0A502EXC7_9FLAO|nr:hypothetical protein [Flavobacterium pectinovorum]TPG41694.1 hypothetical protein EAH81_09445 [Flavobacterium pectinovorum]